MKREPYSKKLKLKFILLAVAVAFLIFSIIYSQQKRSTDKKEYENLVEQESESSKQTETENRISEVETQTEKQDTERRLGLPADAWDETEVTITNVDTYAKDVMEDHTDLLAQRLGEWITDEKLSAKTGTILGVMVPDSDPGSINFYIQLDDSNSSLVLLSYHPRENVVTASPCNYTKEEIEAEAWEGSGPDQRDVSAEEDSEFLINQEGTNATEG